MREPFGATRARRPLLGERVAVGFADDVVGVLEIAQRLGVSRSVVSRWVLSHWSRPDGDVDRPEVVGTVSGQLAYRWRDVERWARRTGRLPADWDD